MDRLDKMLHDILKQTPPTMLEPEDAAYLEELLKLIHEGRPAIIAVETITGSVKFMLSRISRKEALKLYSRLIDSVADKLKDDDE